MINLAKRSRDSKDASSKFNIMEAIYAKYVEYKLTRCSTNCVNLKQR